MMFEETIPTGTKSAFHLHHDSDEVAYVLSGEVTFKIGDEITVGGPGTCTFMPRGIPHAWMSTPPSLALPVKSKSSPPRRARFRPSAGCIVLSCAGRAWLALCWACSSIPPFFR